MESLIELKAGRNDSGRRLDRVLRRLLPALGLSSIFVSVRKGLIKVNGRTVAADRRLAEGDIIALPASFLPATDTAAFDGGGSPVDGDQLPLREGNGPTTVATPGWPGALPSFDELVLLRCEDLVFMNKPRGMLCHGPESLETVVVEAWLRGTDSRSSLSFRPGPLHRLDRNTSGLVTFPLTIAGAQVFSELLRSRRIRKFYLALVEGEIDQTLRWEDRLSRDRKHKVTRADATPDEEGRIALTTLVPLVVSTETTLACLEIHTGLTHQIRAQAALHGHPLVGDRKYGSTRLCPIEGASYYLHAWTLLFPEIPFPDMPPSVTASPVQEELAVLESIFGRKVMVSLSEVEASAPGRAEVLSALYTKC